MTARQLGKEMERAYTAATTGVAILGGSNTGIRLEDSAKQTACAMKCGDMLDADGHPTEQGVAVILDAIETLKHNADAVASNDGGNGKRVPVTDLPAYREAMLAASRAAIALG